MTVLHAGAATDVGRVRTSNEDRLLVAEPLFAVADGMGGHAAGEVAALTAVEALRAGFQANPSADGLADAVRAANRAVWERAREQPELRGMGTTLTALALVREGDDELLGIVNVGDSRAYLLRDGDLDQLTDDHSVPEELRRAGRLSAEEAAVHPQRNVLTRALGVDPDVEVDCFRVTPYRRDRLLLASDGLFNEVDDDRIASVLRRVADPDDAARELVAAAKAHGGSDNITVVVVDVADDGDRAARASAALASDSASGAAGTGPDRGETRAVPTAGHRERTTGGGGGGGGGGRPGMRSATMTGTGRGAGPGTGPGAGAGRGAGTGRGAAAGTGTGRGAAAGTGTGRGAGPGATEPGADGTGGARAVTAAPATAGSRPTGPAAPAAPRPRAVTVRTLLFVLGLLALAGSAIGAIAFFARGSYFVGVQHERVVIFKGRPGGLLWFRPTVEERTRVFVAELRPGAAEAVRLGKPEPSLAAARRYVANVRQEATPPPDATTTTTPSPTTTTGGLAP